MYNYLSDPELYRTGIRRNLTDGDGGGIANEASSPLIDECSIKFNTADVDGDGIGTGGGMWTTPFANPQVLNSVICGNMPNQIFGPWIDLGGNLVADECPADACDADINGDGVINILDFTTLLVEWGKVGVSDADINGDLIVDIADFSTLLITWGSDCSE